MWIENVACDLKAGIMNVTISHEKEIVGADGYLRHQTKHETRQIGMTEEVIGYKCIVLGKAINVPTFQEFDELKKQFAGNADVRFEEKTRFIRPSFEEIHDHIRRQNGEQVEQADDRGFQSNSGRGDYDTANLGFARMREQEASCPEDRVAAMATADDDTECIVIDDEPGMGWTDPTRDS